MINGATLEKIEEVLEGRHADKDTPFYAVERNGDFIFCDDSFLFQVPTEEVSRCPELDWLLQVAESGEELEYVNTLKRGKGWKGRHTPDSGLKFDWTEADDEELAYFDCNTAVARAAGGRIYYCQAYLTVMNLVFGKVYYHLCHRGLSWPLVAYKHRQPVGVIMNMLRLEDK